MSDIVTLLLIVVCIEINGVEEAGRFIFSVIIEVWESKNNYV